MVIKLITRIWPKKLILFHGLKMSYNSTVTYVFNGIYLFHELPQRPILSNTIVSQFSFHHTSFLYDLPNYSMRYKHVMRGENFQQTSWDNLMPITRVLNEILKSYQRRTSFPYQQRLGGKSIRSLIKLEHRYHKFLWFIFLYFDVIYSIVH